MTCDIAESELKDLSALNTDVQQYRRFADTKKHIQFRGFDSETHEGNIFLICNSDGDYLDKITPDKLIEFLFNKKNELTNNFFYNLAFDGEIIIKTVFGKYLEFIPREFQKEIKVDRIKMKFEYRGYKIRYIPEKMLSISKGKKTVSFYDAFQF